MNLVEILVNYVLIRPYANKNEYICLENKLISKYHYAGHKTKV